MPSTAPLLLPDPFYLRNAKALITAEAVVMNLLVHKGEDAAFYF